MSFVPFSPFQFWLPTRILFGEGLLQQAGALIAEHVPGKRIFLVTDPGIVMAGLVDDVLASLHRAHYETDIFQQVAPNPKDVDCELGAEQVRSFQPDLILAIGGGSVIDSAKAIALLHTHPGRIQDYEGRGKVAGPVTPLVAIPTTAGTGSEVTRSSVITDTGRKCKMTVKDVKLAPLLALVDPETTYSLPAPLTAATGMDAFVHAIEAYTCKLANPISDAFALAAMARIWRALPAAVHEGGNRLARQEMMLGSLMAGIAFSHADVAAVHCMAEALGGRYDTPHGVANSIFLPVVTAFNAQADPERHAHAARVCQLPVEGLSSAEASAVLVEALFARAREIGIPRFADLPYVRREDFPSLAAVSYANGSTPSNCRPITENDYLTLFEEAYAGAARA
ncbi:iron-containing alcohol dehydrogenase [Brevibacillus sp. SYP-B805]|nr:iron-containing alcohol dehydrogenase [Brevibacillus sp. SYP-B805]NGQ95373.1 iron-containing alcohol dehydrogenase [Brevibacillus sp. SYP-B805]